MLWFTDLYAYAPSHEEVIASVMDVLEELDEPGKVLTGSGIDGMIDALAANRGYEA